MRVSLKALRVNAGISQREIADKLGVSRMTIMNWESGRTKIPGEELFKFCRICGASTSDIFLPVKVAKSYTEGEKKEWTS